MDLIRDIKTRHHLRPVTSSYIPNTDDDRESMLRTLGITAPEVLFRDIPQKFRDPSLAIPPPLSELELLEELQTLASRNLYRGKYATFLGAGAYNHFIPSVVRALANRGEFLTAYTPYQAEASQGTLQTAYEFQSLVCQLLDMEVANSGMYDGASSFAEAALMACRIKKCYRVAILTSVSPEYRNVLRTYVEPQGIEVEEVPPDISEVVGDVACLMAQTPNFYGYLEDLARLKRVSHASGALLVTSVDPIAMAMFKPPGAYGVDIVTGEGQPLGVPVSYGGPYVGLFACKEEYLRQMPGRIAGRTVDEKGHTGYVLTLQTREQHIRRERATSNICTSQALVGLSVTIYLACMGKTGLRQVAELCYHKAHYAASQIARIPGYSLPFEGTFFEEFVVQCPAPPAQINDFLLQRDIIGGLDIGDHVENGMLLCVTEVNTRDQIDCLVQALSEVTV